LGSHVKIEKLKRKAPQLFIVALVVALVVYIIFEILEDIVIKGVPLTSGSLIAVIASFIGNAKDTVTSWGYSGIFGLMLLEARSLPIPSEVILPFSGYLVAQGLLNFWITVFVATTAAIAGSLIDYYIGLKGVHALTKYHLLGRTLLNEEQLKTASRWFTKYGAVMVFLGRLIPGFRTLISFPAGAVRMPIGKFLAYTLFGCVIWNSLLIYVGYYLGIKWSEVAGISHYLIIIAMAALIAVVVVHLVMRRSRIRKRQLESKQT